MKPLLIVLLLATMAWGGDSWQNCSNKGSICDGIGNCQCIEPSLSGATLVKVEEVPSIQCIRCDDYFKLTNCIPVKCANPKGHCPHCGASGIKFMSFRFEGNECKEQQLPTWKESWGWKNCRAACGEENCATMTCDEDFKDICGYKVYRCENGHVFWEKE